VHDFIDKELGKAIPYGVHDIAADTGWVSVGTDADTAQFAVSTLRTWWNRVGKPAYPHASRLLITADSGGSNGSRLRLWKTELAKFADETGLAVTVCHLPPRDADRVGPQVRGGRTPVRPVPRQPAALLRQRGPRAGTDHDDLRRPSGSLLIGG